MEARYTVRQKMGRRGKLVSATIPDTWYQVLASRAEQMNASMAEIVREAISHGIQHLDRREDAA